MFFEYKVLISSLMLLAVQLTHHVPEF